MHLAPLDLIWEMQEDRCGCSFKRGANASLGSSSLSAKVFHMCREALTNWPSSGDGPSWLQQMQLERRGWAPFLGPVSLIHCSGLSFQH